MDLIDDLLTALFAAWRSEIDSVPFAHEAEFNALVRGLLGDRGHPELETCRHPCRPT